MTLKCIFVLVFCCGVLKIEWNILCFYLNPLDLAKSKGFKSQTVTFFQQVTISLNYLYPEALNLNMVLSMVLNYTFWLTITPCK